MPEMPDSMAAFISAVWRFTSMFAFFMLTRRESVNMMSSGRQTASTSARRHSMPASTISEPMMVRTLMRMSSGPWWASSVISKRSEVMRLMSTPVRLRSKKEKLSFCMWLNTAWRISASMYTPILWPSTVMR